MRGMEVERLIEATRAFIESEILFGLCVSQHSLC
jgi:hypothetical protein